MKVQTRAYRELIDAAAREVALPSWTRGGDRFAPGEWLEGLVLTESNGDPRATRYEPHHDRPGRRDSFGDADTPNHDDGILEDDRSYGLMQVLGSNIRRLCGVGPGVPMRFSFAFLPMTNLAFGLRILTAELGATGGDVARALARYNGGASGDQLDADGRMRREEYVQKVALNAQRARMDRGAARIA